MFTPLSQYIALILDFSTKRLVSSENTFETILSTWFLKVLECLWTCSIFYLINWRRVMFGIFDLSMLKKGILSYQTT